jgi:hypothetical protein
LLGNSPGVTEGKQKNIAGIVILWEEMWTRISGIWSRSGDVSVAAPVECL